MQDSNGFQIPTGVSAGANNVVQPPNAFDNGMVSNVMPNNAMPMSNQMPGLDNSVVPSVPSGMMMPSNDMSTPSGFANVDNSLSSGLSSSINPESLHVYRCGDCKSQFSTNGAMSVNHCIICNSLNIQSNDQNYDSISGIIPFSIPISEAIADYKSKVMANPLVPGIFKKKDVINSMCKLYLPGYLFDVSVSGDVEFLAADKNETVVNGSKGIETRKYGCSYTTNIDYENVFMNSSNVINDTAINGINEFNFASLVPYNSGVVGDAYLLLSDLMKDEAETKMKNNVIKHSINVVRKSIVHELKKTQSNSLMTRFRTSKNIFVPVYFLSVPFQGKNHYYIMNGSNGKSTINIPLNKSSMFILGFIIFAVVFAIAFLLVTLL